MEIDVRQLWESKKGLAFIIAVAGIFILALLAIFFQADVSHAIEAILTAFGFHAGSQGSIDLANEVAPIFQRQATPDTPAVTPKAVQVAPAVQTVSYTPEKTGKPVVRVKTTRYGKGIKAGGWDNYEDSGTDAGMGCFGNKLTNDACALTVSAQRELGAIKYDHILLTWDNGRTRTVRFEDRAPEGDARVDIYLPDADDATIPNYGTAQVVASDDLTA